MKLQLINSDFEVEVSKFIEQKIMFDAIITDIPYNISRQNNFQTMKNRKGRVGINFGEWDFNFDEKKLCILPKILKNGGTLFLFHSFEQFNILQEVFSESLIFKDKIIWQKTNPMPRNRDRRYISNIELASWYVKGKDKWVFNRQNTNYQGSIFTYPSESGGGFKRYHPNQKNLNMMSEIIKIHTNKGDLILDPFMGSGATGVASIINDRRFIGIEKNKEYFQKAEKRIFNKI